jgi:hypothetical protein
VSSAQAVLDRHGADVLKHDRKAFLAGIDPSPRAASYRAAEARADDA